MVLTYSKMVALGSKAPYFKLYDVVNEEEVTLKDIESDIGTVVMFICNHCPYVKHIQEVLLNIASKYIRKGISFVAINANDEIEYPEDGPEEMRRVAENLDFPFPYLFDETQEIAQAYGALCTPDFFVFDDTRRLVYRGQFDDSRPENHLPVTGRDLIEALDCLLKGDEIPFDQQPSSGCSIKWKELSSV